ncbi:MAG: hypothetical protein ACLU92_07435 [Coprococcus comes]
MNETYQNRITDQICKIQNDRHSLPFMTGSATHHSATMHSYMPKGISGKRA